MGSEKSKRIGDGCTAKIESWFDGPHQRRLYQVVIEDSDGSSISVPHKVVDGTREKVDRIFDAISPQDTYNTVFDRLNELDNL